MLLHKATSFEGEIGLGDSDEKTMKNEEKFTSPKPPSKGESCSPPLLSVSTQTGPKDSYGDCLCYFYFAVIKKPIPPPP
jgi:hypothetical protein